MMKPPEGDVNENLKKPASGILVISDEFDEEVETKVQDSEQPTTESVYLEKQKCFVDNDPNNDRGILLLNIIARYEELRGLANRLPLTYYNQVLEQLEEASEPVIKSPPDLGDVEKRPASSEEIQEWLKNVESDLDDIWTRCKTTEKSLDVILPLLCHVSQAYLFINNPERAGAAAEHALNILESESEESWKKIKGWFLCLAGEANLQLFKRRRAQKQCEKAKKLLRSEQDEKLHGHVEKLEDLLFRSFQAEEEEAGDISKVIGPSGGVLDLEECTVYFPGKSLLEKLLLHASMSVDINGKIPGNMIPITPNLRLYPTISLNAPATVNLVTWLAPENPLLVSVYYKKNEDSEWEKLPQEQVRLSGSNRIEFEISQFCQFCAFCDPQKATSSAFWIKSLLFCDPDCKMLANCFFPKCRKHYKEVMKKMTKVRKLKVVCNEEPCLKVRLNDKVTVELQNIRDGKSQSVEQVSNEFTITTEFLELGEHKALSLAMPKTLSGLIDFDHYVSCHGSGNAPGPVSHFDRVELGSSSRGLWDKPNITGNNIAIGGGKIDQKNEGSNATISRGNGE